MLKRKQYIIDKKFQFKTTFSIIGVVSIISALIIAIIASSIVYNNKRIQNIYEIEDQIVLFLTTQNVPADPASPLAQAMREVSQKHFENMETLAGIIEYNRMLMIALVVFIIIQGAILYILMIKKTHRISGPIYVMSNYMKEILDGKLPNPRKLREKDELKEFYDLFVKLVDKIKADKK